MSSVDNRIVNMQFNNKQFEAGANQSKKTLSGLESAVTKTGQSKGLSTLGAGAQAVGRKFSAMQVVGVTALATITNKAVNAGISLIKSLTIDPILQGWDEYNTNLKSIQTVMANTGKGLKPVQSALQQLNAYSDQTIYNFSEMAKNVGTFTAAGVGLKDSVSAIKGISNMAALSGSTSQQASTAMYQLSQAIAAGRVNLQDWNSVVNAGMGGKNLQTALIQTGQAMGTLKGKVDLTGKSIKVMGESFRESISAKPGSTPWLTSDVLVKTLALMDGRMSKTAITAKLLAKNMALPAKQQLTTSEMTAKASVELEKQQKIMAKQGYTPAQIKSLTAMADEAYKSATVIKTLPQLLGVIKESIGSVWSNVFSGVVGNFNQSKRLWTNINNTIGQSIKNFSGTLNNMIVGWKRGVDGLGGRMAVIDGFRSLFSSLGKIMGALKGAFSDVFPPGDGVMLNKLSIGWMHLMAALRPSEATIKSLRSIFGGVFAVLHIGVSIVGAIAKGFGALFGALFAGSGKAGGGVLQMLGSVGELLKSFDKWLTEGGKLSDFMTNLGTIVGTALHPVVAIISGVAAALGSLVSGGNPFAAITGSLGSLSSSGDKVAGVFDRIKAAFSGIDTSKLKSMFNNLDFAKAGDMARQGIDIAAGLVTGIAQGIASEGLPAIMSAVSAMGSKVIDFVKGVFGINSPATTMIPIGQFIVMGIAQGIVGGIKALPAALGMVAKAVGDTLLQLLHNLPAIISGGAKFVHEAFAQLFGGMDSLDFASLINAALAGGALLAFKKFSDTIAKGIGGTLGGVSNVFEQLTDTLKSMQHEVRAKMLMEIAIAVGVMTASLIALSFVPMDRLAKGLGALAIMLGLLTVSLMVMNKIGQTVDEDGKTINKFNFNLIALGASMLLIATAMIALATAVAIFGSMDVKTLSKGLIGMAVGMGILIGSMLIVSKLPKGSIEGFAGSIMVLSLAMNVMAAAIAVMGHMSMESLAKGLIAMAIGLGLMVGSLLILSKFGPAVAVSAGAMIAMATALVIMSVAVAAFGNMDIGTLAKGFIALALGLALMVGALVILGANIEGTIVAAGAMIAMATAMAMLVPVIATLGGMDMGTLAKGLIALGIALTLFVVAVTVLGAVATVVGPGLLMLGGALALAGVGMLAFGTGFALMAAAGVAGVAVLSAAFVAIIALLPQLATQVAAALTAMIETFAKAAPRWRTAMSTIIKNMLGVVRDAIPQLAKIAQALITAAINVIKKSVPQWVEAGFTIIDKFLQSAAKHAPSIIKSVTSLIVTFLNGIGNALPRIVNAGLNMILKFINGLTTAINNNSSKLAGAGLRLGMALVNGMTGGLLGKGVALVKSAIAKMLAVIPEWARKILHINSPSKLSTYWGEMVGAGLAVGMGNSHRSTIQATQDLAGTIPEAFESAMDIHSPSKKAVWWGQQIGNGLSLGLSKSITPAVKATLELVNSVIAAGNATVLKSARNNEIALAKASKASVLADIAKKRAAAIPNTKKTKKAKDAADKAATAAQNRADAAANAASSSQTALENAIAFRDADTKGKADIMQESATANANRAAQLMAKAAQESASAKAMAKTNAKLANQLRLQATKDAAAAKKAALAAKTQQGAALTYYAAEVNTRIAAMKEAQAAEEKIKAEQVELDNATSPQNKADILNARAKALEAQADAKKKEVQSLISRAQALANKDAVAANKLLDQADQAAADAKAAADEAAQDRSAAESALGTDTTTTSTPSSSGDVGGITPSRSVLEDAASIIDQYSKSLAEAQEQALADQPVMQFVQNNTSPEALSTSEIYRQSNNLMSLAAQKLGQKPS